MAAIGDQDSSAGATAPPPTLPTEEPDLEATRAAEETAAQPQPSDTPVPTPTEAIDFDTWMQSAKILLYEDMVARVDTNRYVRDTLDEMGLSYKDDGNAQGWLKTDLAGGESWDLVIIAAEAKKSAQGELFDYVIQALDQGASVIFEVWFLNQTHASTGSMLLDRCGIDFYANWYNVPPAGQVMFPVSNHSLLNDPHSLSFTNVTSFWWDPSRKEDYDIGDLMKLGSGGDAAILASSQPQESNTHGTLTLCIDERLILQTFSSHQIVFDDMTLVWENYIRHALRVRLEGLQ
jgi:hypothetical protein